ncbi:RICIN domain-containing protein [Kutzneria kofuensis]|uniref:Ricin B lectin domain-containing protein n=1 Tax=Kutzneria kofuensis TaxID=103725 RepID=A0A7W9KPD7_9PSEU|nr:RICIN domain-containing protein [Kutzneria kofuensis]MBB5896202.1 hypothetical protein [Kutzneria kofuensis]
MPGKKACVLTIAAATAVALTTANGYVASATAASGQELHNGLNWNKCLDAQTPDGLTLTGAVQVWDCNGGPQQDWFDNSDGTKFNGLNRSKCLDAQTLDGRTLTGAVQVWDCNGGPQQRWFFTPDHRIHNGLNWNKCLDAQTLDGVTLTGVVQVWNCNNGPQQRWYR